MTIPISWIDRYRGSVSWGDQIHAETLPDGSPCCWTEIKGGRFYTVPGFLGDLHGAIDRAQQTQHMPDCNLAVVQFLDEDATDFQVEEACHVLAAAGLGCGFLEPRPRVRHHLLLERASEGTIFDRIFDPQKETP